VKGTAPRHAIWLFYAAGGPEVTAGEHAFDGEQAVSVEQVKRHYFVVRSRSALPPRDLVALGQSLRERWKRAVPANARVEELLIADRQLLQRPPHCVPYGELGDPDISPHWPPVKTSHQ
jgi:hypothetical protein